MEKKVGFLIQKASDGDKDAFKELYKLKYDDIYFLAMKILGNHHDAEDVVQEVVVKIYNNLNALKSADSFDSWVYSVVTNHCYSFLRKDIKRKNGITNDENAELDVQDDSIEVIPHKSLEEDEFVKYMATIIKKLPSERQQCFHLHYYDGLKYREIADILELSIHTVGSHIKRARKIIKDEMEKSTFYDVYFEREEQENA